MKSSVEDDSHPVPPIPLSGGQDRLSYNLPENSIVSVIVPCYNGARFLEDALRSALSMHAERGSLAVFDTAAFSAPSTKQAAALLRDWDPAQTKASTLVVLHESEEFAGKSFRNLPTVVVLPAEDAGVANVIGASRLLVSEAALPALVARANGTAGTEEEGDN